MDENGVLITDADQEITFDISGEVKNIGIDNRDYHEWISKGRKLGCQSIALQLWNKPKQIPRQPVANLWDWRA